MIDFCIQSLYMQSHPVTHFNHTFDITPVRASIAAIFNPSALRKNGGLDAKRVWQGIQWDTILANSVIFSVCMTCAFPTTSISFLRASLRQNLLLVTWIGMIKICISTKHNSYTDIRETHIQSESGLWPGFKS